MLVPRWGVSLVALGLAWFHPVFGLGAMFVLHLFGTLSYLWGMLIEPHDLSLTTLSLKIPQWPADSRPVRLLHLSDLHLERLTRREEHLLNLVAEAKADVILISGDYLNLSYIEDPTAIEQVRAWLPKLVPHARLGVFATLGSPPVDLRHITPAHFAENEVTLLRNAVRLLDVGAGRQLAILGLDCTHDMTYDEYHFKQVFAQFEQIQPADKPTATVLLYHSPEAMPFVQNYPINLYLCGHTHGGQVRLPWYGALLTSSSTGKRYEMGRYTENGTTLYVSRGIGLEGMPMPRLRLLCPPELTLVTLTGGSE
jgi:predicted MPP superfamily phosphohydrolase